MEKDNGDIKTSTVVTPTATPSSTPIAPTSAALATAKTAATATQATAPTSATTATKKKPSTLNLPLSSKKTIRYHSKLRSYYLSSCLKSLDSILHSKPKILNNIESLLMTILILASDYSATTGSQWRAHLRGAKDLLIKYCRFKPMNLELSIVWIWFYAMEILAGLTVPAGGSIHDFDEMLEFLRNPRF
ncbi:unnamed protein product [[Candida] boidinii]|nr:unnamed protein product [[Candida] boidinii]